ncbi:PQQ-binding-like beta-propeller repeat protein [Brachybacterium paraconglomeratum]|uniref:outer membrane protein assembly factor BamB family protein n=1 Tax=Brachybacterium paraconglomeratum TaxID=173362 RepID=UPI0031EA76FA
MNKISPWAPRSEDPDAQEHSEPGDRELDLPGPLPTDGMGAEEDATIDLTTALGFAVVMLAAAGICTLLGGHFLVGALRLAAGILAGLGIGAVVLALIGARLRSRPRALLAGATALVVMLALTIPAVLATRLDPLSEHAAAAIDALEQGDTVHSLPEPGTPVLVRRADGGAQLLDGNGARSLEALPEDVLALSADGTRLIRATGAATEVLLLGPTSSTADGDHPSQTFAGTPLALAGDLLVMRHCADGLCRISGYDLTDPEAALWTLLDAEQTRGVDPLGVEVPARRGALSGAQPDAEAGAQPDAQAGAQPGAQPGLLDAVRATGVLPAVPLRFDPAQGWVQLDPATGFPVGRILAGPEEDCRIAATGPTPHPQDPLREVPLVLTVCSAEDGALTATAHQSGEPLWESAASPAGDWSARIDQGRVLATGIEAGAETAGEIVASEQRAQWTAPGADGVAEAEKFTARIGIDGRVMVVANASGQLVAYETAAGANLWTLPLSSPDATVRGSFMAGTAVVLDPVVRESPLDPRGAQRLRVIDTASGELTAEAVVDDGIGAVHPLGGGRALVTVDGKSLLLGP